MWYLYGKTKEVNNLTDLPNKPKSAKEIVDKDKTIEQLLAVIHYLLEDRPRQRKNFGSELLFRAEFATKDEKILVMDAIATNRENLVTSFRFYDPNTKGDEWKYYNWRDHQDIEIQTNIPEGDEVTPNELLNKDLTNQ